MRGTYEHIGVFKEILASGQTEDSKQWVRVRPDFYNVRSDLTVLNEILMKGKHLHIPPSLRTKVLGVFHQSKTGMNIRADNSVWWQGITKDIESLHLQFGDCEINAPVCQLLLPHHWTIHSILSSMSVQPTFSIVITGILSW